MEFTIAERNRLRLRRRWDITLDWFGYSPALQRVHLALLLRRELLSTRAVAAYANLPHTTTRRKLDELDWGKHIDRTADGVQISELGAALAVDFHRDLYRYVHGGIRLNPKLLQIHKQTFGGHHADFEILEHHIWWPLIGCADD